MLVKIYFIPSIRSLNNKLRLFEFSSFIILLASTFVHAINAIRNIAVPNKYIGNRLTCCKTIPANIGPITLAMLLEVISTPIALGYNLLSTISLKRDLLIGKSNDQANPATKAPQQI